MRVLVCGGRNYSDDTRVFQELDKLAEASPDPLVIIQGGASGADYHAIKWVYSQQRQERIYELVTYQADWAQYGKRADPTRNATMLSDGKPDVVLAFPGGAGTEDMITRAKAAGVKVIQIEE